MSLHPNRHLHSADRRSLLDPRSWRSLCPDCQPRALNNWSLRDPYLSKSPCRAARPSSPHHQSFCSHSRSRSSPLRASAGARGRRRCRSPRRHHLHGVGHQPMTHVTAGSSQRRSAAEPPQAQAPNRPRVQRRWIIGTCRAWFPDLPEMLRSWRREPPLPRLALPKLKPRGTTGRIEPVPQSCEPTPPSAALAMPSGVPLRCSGAWRRSRDGAQRRPHRRLCLCCLSTWRSPCDSHGTAPLRARQKQHLPGILSPWLSAPGSGHEGPSPVSVRRWPVRCRRPCGRCRGCSSSRAPRTRSLPSVS